MGKVFDSINADLQAFIEKQPLFFVATAPLGADGRVNLSPKGLDSLRVLSPTRVAYLDLTGSGNETAAHIAENGRITFMFCAFNGPPRIVRLYGKGMIALPDSLLWNELIVHFTGHPGMRQIIVADLTRVQTSCGYAVPLMEFVRERDTLLQWAEARGDRLDDYRAKNNARSIDGLPASLPPSGWGTGGTELERRGRLSDRPSVVNLRKKLSKWAKGT
jgi:hypothetical protein